MTTIVHLLVGALAFGGFITNALPQTPVNAGSMLIDALYAGLICMAFRSLDWSNVVRWRFPLALFGAFALWCLGMTLWGPGALGQRVMGFRNNVVYPGIWALLAMSAVRFDVRRILEAIWWTGLAVCAFAIVQGVFHHQLPDSLMVLGHNDTRFGFAGEDIFRVTGLVGNTIVFTGFSAIVLLIGWMRPERETSIWHKLLEIVPAVALYMTYTRTANVSILLVWGFAWSFFRMKRLWCGIARYAFVLAVIVVLVSGDAGESPQAKTVRWLKNHVVLAEIDFLMDRMSSQEITSQASRNFHALLYRKGVDLFLAHPIVGTGIGSQGYSSHEPDSVNVMKDGYWMATLLELGVPGMILWLAFLSWLARYLFVRAYATWRDTTSEGCLSHRLSLLLLLVFAYFSIASALNSAYSARTSQCFVWMLVGLLLTMDKGVRKLS